MARVDQTVTIHRPLDAVYAVLSDPTQTPRWSAPAIREWVTTPGPLGVGSRRRTISRMGPVRTENEAEVTEFDPGRRIVLRSISGPVPFVVAMDFLALGAGSARIDWSWTFSPRGVMRLMDPLIGPMWRRSFGRDLRTLKRMLESGEL